ncbi:hypothetical protein CAPTEDRAFT_193083 [Capitella teleta]|uniref:Uncharacterized protein n=1 Tax=Capitella teleta TaxID=283909 RepID=R7TIW4_CAPTE|nr:hypothetical protein CAPTEDRAFT_193083 [Capitella teleta]|eukprot:ELT93763.1 hypothetical protein CAPTEDRAFT_193083 [Capitella teleta]
MDTKLKLAPSMVNLLLRYNLRSLIFRQMRSLSSTSKLYEKGSLKEAPVRLSESAASGYSTLEDMKPKVRDVPLLQAPIFLVSFGAFLIYFLVLREENDLDDLIPPIPGTANRDNK